MALRSDMEIRDYLAVFWQWNWFIFFNFLVILSGAAVYLVVVPPQYKSTTTVLIIPQRIPENYVQSAVSMRVENRLLTIKQQVTSRTVLSKVMDELDLFPEQRRKSLPEDVIEGMRNRIEIEVVQKRNQIRMADQSEYIFSISFFHEDPKLAMLTTSHLASLFTEENRRSREQAAGTSEFLESQLQATKAELEIQEEKIKRYKLQFMGELPEEMQRNLVALTRLQENLRTNTDNIRVVEGRKVFLEARRSTLENTLKQVVGYQDNLVSEDPGKLLLMKRAQVAELASKYTDSHPSLINLRKEVEYLEKRFRDTSGNTLEPSIGDGEKSVGSSPPDISLFRREKEERSSPDFFLPNREKDDLRTINAEILSAKAELSSLKKENQRIKEEITALQQKVDRSPRREQELLALTRDYDNLKNTYENLLKKRLDANISQNLLERQQGEQFQILDPANLPMKPFKPKKRKVFLIALLIAAGFSFGGAFGLESLDETLRGPKDFQNFFKLRVLACIPDIEDDTLARQRALRLGAIVSGCLVFFAGILIFIWFFEEKIRAILKI